MKPQWNTRWELLKQETGDARKSSGCWFMYGFGQRSKNTICIKPLEPTRTQKPNFEVCSFQTYAYVHVEFIMCICRIIYMVGQIFPLRIK